MKTRYLVKRIVKSLFLLTALPLYFTYRLLSALGKTDACFASFSQAISLIPGKTGIYLRAAFYHLSCPETSDDISVGFLTILSHQNTTIKKGAYIGPQCNIGMCTISENTLIGSGVHIMSGKRQHNFKRIDIPIKEQGGVFEKIIIEENCWVGNLAIIMSSLPEGCIVAAGAVVNRRPEPFHIVAGNPAASIKTREKI